MRPLTKSELDFITNCPCILEEEVVRPVRRKPVTVEEKINNQFAEVASELNSYSVKKDDIIRDIHHTAYEWSKDESPEIIAEVITSYCPVHMTKKDINSLVNNAVRI